LKVIADAGRPFRTIGSIGRDGLNSGAVSRMSTQTGIRIPHMAKTNPLTFLQQVRSETAKVVWPNRREVTVSTVMVLILAALTAVFFFFVDWLIRQGLAGLLGLVG
jgi:preprotein translocase subunit SecE